MYRDFKDVPEDEKLFARRLAELHTQLHAPGCPEEVIQKFAEMIATHGLVDNLRIARIDRPRQVMRYKSQADDGHGQRHDERLSADGVDWVYGCNYGH